jgi:wobble nucleotide-excising tRNase
LEARISEILEGANELLNTIVNQVAIKRLKENSDIAKWVIHGHMLHEKHSSTTCEYCGQGIPEERIDELAAHFSTAYQELMDAVDGLLSRLRIIYAEINDCAVPDKANLYEQLQNKYSKDCLDLGQHKNLLLDSLTRLGQKLNEKKTKAHEALPEFTTFNSTSFTEAVESINIIISEHNKNTDEFDANTKDASEKLEKHYVSTIYDEVKKYDIDLEIINQQNDETNNLIKALNANIVSDESRLRNSKIACERINKMLEQFLGRKELCLQDDELGYVIKRGDI